MSEFLPESLPISLTTDFGTSDWFVGVMKGVMVGINPKAHLIDITHHISPGNIRGAAFILMQSILWFPSKTVHMAVIDPGVGTLRNGLIIETNSCFLVGPDNGIFSWAILNLDLRQVFRLNPSKFDGEISHTFHGRDLFAPAAAKLSLGVNPNQLGEKIDSMVSLEWPKHEISETGIFGQIIHEDRFGNLITNIPHSSVPASIKNLDLKVRIPNGVISIRIHPTYGHAPDGQPALIEASTGFLEFAIKNGSAAKFLDWSAGHKFELIF